MDRLIYTAMTGAKHTLEQQATTSHNLANATTTGFREQIDQFRAVPVQGAILPTRTFVADSSTGSNFASGGDPANGRELMWRFRAKAGWWWRRPTQRSYTRNGSLKMDENGLLLTRDGLTVQGDSGPCRFRRQQSCRGCRRYDFLLPEGSEPTGLTTVGRLKMVNHRCRSGAGRRGLFA